MKIKRKRPPMQPVVFDDVGVVRFQTNILVHKLLEFATLHGFGLNEIAIFSADNNVPVSDQEQFAQLIGYSVSGFGDLSYARPTTVALADARADVLVKLAAASEKPL